MSGFTKLFSTIITSSIWSEDGNICKAWVTLLALAEPTGFVPASLPGIANAARLPLDTMVEIIRKFESPDEYSRSTDFDGRRIEKVEGGWLILNYRFYRETKGTSPVSTEKRATYNREWMRRHRATIKSTKQSTPVHVSASASASVPGGEYRGEVLKESQQPSPPPFKRAEFDAAALNLSVPDWERDSCWAYYDRQGWVTGGLHPKRIQGDPRSTLLTWLANSRRDNGKKDSSPNI